MTSATAFIAAQPRAIEQIKANTEEVMFSIRRAENIAVAVKTLKALPQKDYESYLVNYENILLSITQALDAEDNRDLTFEQQGNRLVTFIESKLSEQQAAIQAQQTLTTELKRQNAYNALLEQKIIALTATENTEEDLDNVATVEENVRENDEEQNIETIE
ncbi:hypothetical protein J9B83_05305 [Marinomonas sp. A79]|uniref:Uncharacterized protein n=1 Tax=Marinomonas vulgaris TaxID=2823372 RepID=A0ABS5H9J5_9GAMM|nr:hypothetical protein [Marinomonas vulgaris]MBR7888353.1 hypothetical protein [Marinomonas vulgaris]